MDNKTKNKVISETKKLDGRVLEFIFMKDLCKKLNGEIIIKTKDNINYCWIKCKTSEYKKHTKNIECSCCKENAKINVYLLLSAKIGLCENCFIEKYS